MNDLPPPEYTNSMSKHRSHVDRKRNEYGNALTKMRLGQMERLNKAAPLIEYNLESFTGKFEVYNPNKKKGRKSDVFI
ncbi:hypothetical protein Pmgp_03175 [Pelotomaculum propionicicum]|uniref:Uncharacterized protein n=2 Tax=Pelotomaculum propionicicum TaxID=258475 RepID=A0A4Y7RK86_9FIRM|nr:hypothetical protein Pmgp_03175 [Pelotomaculum propionicicum]